MGVNDKFCKVTVHRASPPPPSPPTKMQTRPRRQTIGTDVEASSFFFQPPSQRQPAYVRATERYRTNATTVSEIIPDEEFDAMLQSAEQTRRRAKTDATGGANARASGVEVIKGRKMNPLSRLTLRWTEQRESARFSDKAPLFADDDDDDDETNNTIDILDDLMDSNQLDDDDEEPPLLDIRANGEFTNSFLECDTNENDPVRQTLDDLFTAGTPPIPAGLTLDMLPTAFSDTSLPMTFSRGLYSSNVPQSDDPFHSLARMHHHHHNSSSAPSETDDDDDSVATSSMLDYESEEEVNIDEVRNKAEAIARFEASFQDRATPLFRTTEIPTRRMNRGMSSPPRMLSQVIRTRKQSNPVHPRSHGSSASEDLNNARNALYSGQMLHLNFKNSSSQVVQVSGQPKKSGSKNIFSKRIRCQAVDEALPMDIRDALRIIGHTTDGIIHGGDCISIARNDGHVLRLQSLSKKLCFSPKIDLRAKFIVTGVPEGTVVTSKSKFYLQSVYDRSKTVGFLKSRRSSSPGYLVMYAYRNKEDKSEPIQFFQRVEQTAAEVVGISRQQRTAQQQLAAVDLTPVNRDDDGDHLL
ncbi:hypothetical protein Gpo141_00011941 [Globisporangium polare]